MRTNPSFSRHRSAFTLIELLVTMVIIVVLIALSFSGFRHVRLSAHKAVSVSNIKNLSAIVLGSASDNAGHFREIHIGNGSPNHISRAFRDYYGVTRQFAYSPANTCWKQDGMDHCNPRDLWDFNGPNGISTVWGYSCFINDYVGSINRNWADSGVFEKPDNWEQIKDRVTYRDSTGKTVTRWLPKRIGEEVVYPILFTDLCRVYEGGTVGNFMKDETNALGTHVGYLDGRIEWVDGETMKVRHTQNGQSNIW